MPQNRPYIGPERSAGTVTSSQLSGTNNTGSHHQSAPAVLAHAPPAQHSRSRHSEHRSRRSNHAEAAAPHDIVEVAPDELGTHHSHSGSRHSEHRSQRSNHAEAGLAPVPHHSRHGTNRASSHRELSRNHGHNMEDIHELAHEHAHDFHDLAQDPASPAKGKRVIGDDERVPSMLWYFSGGTGPPPTGKQFRKMTREKRKK